MGFFDRFKKFDKNAKVKKAEHKAPKAVVEDKEAKETVSTLKEKTDTKTVATLKEKEIKVKKSKKDDTKDAYKILLKPLVTEKATDLASSNKYCFKVAKSANKITVKKAIKDVYGYMRLNINIINMSGKAVRYGRISGRTKHWKKAIVTLKKGEKIEIYEGV
jgi:large subunit ribosomal protein L23